MTGYKVMLTCTNNKTGSKTLPKSQTQITYNNLVADATTPANCNFSIIATNLAGDGSATITMFKTPLIGMFANLFISDLCVSCDSFILCEL